MPVCAIITYILKYWIYTEDTDIKKIDLTKYDSIFFPYELQFHPINLI